MLRSVHLQNWKSFADATLELEPLTVLIGLNASGKSNALDALAFLRRTASGTDLSQALSSDLGSDGIRGGVEWAARRGSDSLTIEAVVADAADEETEYAYAVSIDVRPRLQLRGESLRRTRRKPIDLFRTGELGAEQPQATAYLYNKKAGDRRDFRRNATILSQLAATNVREEVERGVRVVHQALASIFVLDPQPARMRNFWPLAEELRTDGANVSGVLAALSDERRRVVEEKLRADLGKLAEPDVLAAWAEKVGKFGADAMLYCREGFGDGSPIEVDARGMSDGTLRFVAIITALLTRPKGSLLVIEEIDNGLHPSRAGMLLSMLVEMQETSGVDILATTHNVAFLDALPPELVPTVVVARRAEPSGASELVVLEDLATLPKLLAMGPLGRAAVSGALERALRSGRARPLTGT